MGLGANLGDPIATLRDAIAKLQANPATTGWLISPFYRTAPVGSDEDQPDYINAVAVCHTDLPPEAMMQWLLDTERHFGRDRGHDVIRNAPRTLDLDLLIYDDVTLQTPLLTLPHPRLHERAFALVPLVEAWPDAVIPGIGGAQACLDAMAGEGIEALP